MVDVSDDQLIDDREFLENLIANEHQILDDNIPGRKREVIAILERLKSAGTRRRGATKEILLNIRPLIAGGPEVTPIMNKPVIVDTYLTFLTGHVGENDEQLEESKHNDDGPPEGVCPVGWGSLVSGGPSPVDNQMELPLLRLQRGPWEISPKEKLRLLLKEQDDCREKKRSGNTSFLTYIRKNLQEMTQNPSPLPTATSTQWIWYLYEKALEREILHYQNLTMENYYKSRSDRVPVLISDSDSSSSTSDSDSDSDLASFAPNKRYALPVKRRKRSKKRKRNRKKSKTKKKKRRRRSPSPSSDSSTSSYSSSNETEDPNGKRVSAKAMGPYQIEQMREFREGYREYIKGGGLGDWPDDAVLSFISKKFARTGSKFAHKTQGVKRRFLTQTEKNHARKRTAEIYDMCDTVAQLRLERNEVLANEMRRMRGASQAKRARQKQRARKIKQASLDEEQTLLARVGVYCDLVLLGRKAWDAYHNELGLGGQKEAIVESLGGGITASVAAKAWKSAQKLGLHPTKKTPKSKSRERHLASLAGRTCYWCNRKGHIGKYCPSKLSGKPPHPNSKQAQWDKANPAAAAPASPAGAAPNKIKIEQPASKVRFQKKK